MQINHLARWANRVAGALLVSIAPAQALALDVDDARHLLTRTGFGAAPHELHSLRTLSREQAVDALLASLDARPPLAPPPAFVSQSLEGYAERLGVEYVPRGMAEGTVPEVDTVEYERLTQVGMLEMEQLRVWWLDRMVSTPAPFAERLALFWHGHFTSKYFDVLAPRLMHDQLETLRTHGTRNFGALMHAMVRDPAMLIFLDNAFNTPTQPNENLARELLELFTMGVGHYDEADVKVLGRKMAGHTVDFQGDWRYRQRRAELDTQPRPFLGKRVRTLEDAERAILSHPQTARFIAAKFYREFVADRDDTMEIERLAGSLRAHRHDLRPMLRTMLLSPAFWAAENRGALVKSPVELLVGLVRTLGLQMPDLGRLAQDARLLGQELFEPPTVKGWKPGMAWLNMATLRQRSDVIGALTRCANLATDSRVGDASDLLVRFSVERSGDAPVSLRVLVDGQEVASGPSRCPSDLRAQPAGEGITKPAWDLLRVARASLPASPRSLGVVFDRAPGQEANVFVNWVQIDGQRLPAMLASQTYFNGETCTGQEPKGMLYCRATLHFDLEATRRTQARIDPTLYDRRFGKVNAVIESGTTRLPLQLRPAGRDAVGAHELEQLWRNLPLHSALLPVPPLTHIGQAHADTTALLEALLADPAFNLK